MKLLNILAAFSLAKEALSGVVLPPPRNEPLGVSASYKHWRRNQPRLILYQQTHHDEHNKPVSLLPLVNISQVTHVYIAAFHIHGPGVIRLNDHPVYHKRFDLLWSEIPILRHNGIKVMAMLGGAAVGSYRGFSRKNLKKV